MGTLVGRVCRVKKNDIVVRPDSKIFIEQQAHQLFLVFLLVSRVPGLANGAVNNGLKFVRVNCDVARLDVLHGAIENAPAEYVPLSPTSSWEQPLGLFDHDKTC